MSAPVPVRPAPRQLRSAALLALTVLLAVVGALAPAGPARAADPVVVSLTADGPVPAEVSFPAGGGVVRFVNDDATTHRLTSPGFPEEGYELAPAGIGRERGTVDVRVERSGTLDYTDTRVRALLGDQEFPGRIVVAAPPPPPPSQEPAPQAPPAAGGAPAPGPPAPAPPQAAAPGGSGNASLPGLVGDLQVPGLTAPPADSAVVPPAIAGLFGEAPAVAPPSAAPDPRPQVQALRGPLPGEGTSRPLGLPAALAALAVVGVVSLLVRVLLAEPAARAARPLLAVRVATAD